MARAHLDVGHAKVIGGIGRRQIDGPTNLREGSVVVILLMEQNTEHVMNIGVAWIVLQQLPIERFRSGQIAVLVMVQCQVEYVGARKHTSIIPKFSSGSKNRVAVPVRKIKSTARVLAQLVLRTGAKLGKGNGNALKNIVPNVLLVLPKQTHRWIPGAIGTLQQPAPIGNQR